MCSCLSAIGLTLSAQAPTEKGRLGIPLTEITRPWTGDLPGMVERRMVRVLTTYSKTQYFIDRGTPRGTAYDQGKLLEEAPEIIEAYLEAVREDGIEFASDESFLLATVRVGAPSAA